MMARSLLALAVVVAVIYLLYKYVLIHWAQPGHKSATLKIKERAALEPGAALYIVASRNKSWLLGVSRGQISLIDRLEPDNSTEEPAK